MWDLLEFGRRRKSWKRFRRAMFCRPLDKNGQMLLEFVRPVSFLYANLGMASPVYYWDIPGQLRCFVDRTFSYLVPDFITNPVKSRLKPGNKLVFILAQSNPA